MKRLLLSMAILGAAALLGGCPIYPNQGNEYRVCQGAGCYSCPDPSYSGACINWQCSEDTDCDSGYVCNNDAQCVPASPADAGGDCSVNGCPSGFVCKLSNGAAQCVSLGSGGDAGADGSNKGDAGGGDSASASDASDASIYGGPCNADGDCGGHGTKCVDGTCTAQVGLCSDGTQCRVLGSSCVDGLCEATCSSTTPCPSGYGCDFTRGVCNLDPGACAGSGVSTCQGGATCVENHCVPPCNAASDAGPACAAGQVCVNGGCIPDQAATFACVNDGDQGQLANACADGFICLHHDCYAACSFVGGAGCDNLTCTDVTIETGTYAVCAEPGTLGSGCDPAQGKYCESGVCINGSCH